MQFAKKAGILTLAVVLTLGLGVSVTNDWGDTSVAVTFNEAIAKFRGGGFSSSSVRVSSFRSSTPKATSSWGSKTTKTTTSSKPTVAKTTTTTTKAVAPRKTAFTQAATRTQAKQQAASYQSKFSKPVTKKSTTTTLASAPPATQTRLANVNRTTYYDRRSSTMDTYRQRSTVPQTVIYQGSPSYGVTDSWFFWYVVLNDPMYGHNHANDPSYLAWKREARELSRENAELQKQLDAHESAVARQTGNPDPNYMPAGVDADVIFAPQFVEATKPTIRLCTGRTDGTYFETGTSFMQLVSQSQVKLVATEGSVQNLAMVEKGDCDAALVQRDAYIAYGVDNPDNSLSLTRLAGLYNEHVHMFCTRDTNVYNVEDLNGRSDITMFAGTKGSGGSVTWQNFVTLNDTFANVPVVDKFGTDSTFGTQNSCGIYVGYLNSDFMKKVSERDVRLVDIETVPTEEIRDSEGETIYANNTITSGTYTIQHGWNDSGFYSDTPTVTVPVDVVVSDTWKANTTSATAILNELDRLKGAVVNVL